MSITVMKQALAKFESLWEIGIDAVYKVELLPEIRALRQAIEQAENMKPTLFYGRAVYFADPQTGEIKAPHKKWVGLTDDDLRQIILVSIGVAEAKLKEKNSGR